MAPDVAAQVDQITQVITAVAAIATAVLGVYVMKKSFKWFRYAATGEYWVGCPECGCEIPGDHEGSVCPDCGHDLLADYLDGESQHVVCPTCGELFDDYGPNASLIAESGECMDCHGVSEYGDGDDDGGIPCPECGEEMPEHVLASGEGCPACGFGNDDGVIY